MIEPYRAPARSSKGQLQVGRCSLGGAWTIGDLQVETVRSLEPKTLKSGSVVVGSGLQSTFAEFGPYAVATPWGNDECEFIDSHSQRSVG